MARIFVKAKPKSKKEYVKRVEGLNFVIAVGAPAEKGKANYAIIRSLAEFLNISASSISLVSGQTSREKVFEVPINENDLPKIYQQVVQMKMF